MNKSFLNLFILFSLFFKQISAQNESKIKWVKDFDAKNYVPKLLASRNNLSYFIRFEGYTPTFDNTLKNYTFLIYNNKTDKFIYELKAETHKILRPLSELYLTEFLVDTINGDIILISKNKKTSKTNKYYITIYDSTFSKIKRNELLKESVTDLDIDPVLSPVKDFPLTKYIGYSYEDGKKTLDSIEYILYDNSFNVIKNIKFRKPYYEKGFYIYGVQLNEKGKILLFGQYYENKSDIRNNESSTVIISYDFQKNSFSEAVYIPKIDSLNISYVTSVSRDSIIDFIAPYAVKFKNSKGKEETKEGTFGILLLKYNTLTNKLIEQKNYDFSKISNAILSKYLLNDNNEKKLDKSFYYDRFFYHKSSSTYQVIFEQSIPPSGMLGFEINSKDNFPLWTKKDILMLSFNAENLELKTVTAFPKYTTATKYLEGRNPANLHYGKVHNRQFLLGKKTIKLNNDPFIIFSDRIDNQNNNGVLEYDFGEKTAAGTFIIKIMEDGSPYKELLFDYKLFRLYTLLTTPFDQNKLLIFAAPNKDNNKIIMGILEIEP